MSCIDTIESDCMLFWVISRIGGHQDRGGGYTKSSRSADDRAVAGSQGTKLLLLKGARPEKGYELHLSIILQLCQEHKR